MNIEKAKRGRKGEKPKISSFGHLPVFRAAATQSGREIRAKRAAGLETQGKNMQENAQPAAARRGGGARAA